MCGIKGYSPKYFNPRSHEGSDATWVLMRQAKQNFNPRSHEGSDFILPAFLGLLRIFQSTLPRRERRQVLAGA